MVAPIPPAPISRDHADRARPAHRSGPGPPRPAARRRIALRGTGLIVTPSCILTRPEDVRHRPPAGSRRQVRRGPGPPRRAERRSAGEPGERPRGTGAGDEAFLLPGHPLHAKFARLSEQEEKHGLLTDTATIGTRDGWNARLKEAGFAVRGHRLVKK